MGKRKSLDDYPAMMDSADVAELLGHPVKQIQLMAREGRLPAERPPGSHAWRFRRDELLAWMRSDATRVDPQ
jgi:excisionase family DNA binding protein